MTNETWILGYGKLCAAFVPRKDSEMVDYAARGAVYREHLDEMSDGAWLHAVSAAIRTSEWFPTVAELWDLAREWRGGATLAKHDLPALGSGSHIRLLDKP